MENLIETLDLDLALDIGSLVMGGAGNCPDLRACMRDRCIGACTDSPPEPEPAAASAIV